MNACTVQRDRTLPVGEKLQLKVLIGYPYFKSDAYQDIQQLEMQYLARLRQAGFLAEGFCLTLDPPAPRLSFRDLDARWRRGDKTLMKLYERLEQQLNGKDVFINEAGINLHPEFVERLPVFTVFQCFDDPESSHDLSRPVAHSYDLCLVGNIAELETYQSWGVKRVEWTPLGLMPEIYDSTLSFDAILNGERDIDFFMMCDRLSTWRRARLDILHAAFPGAHFYGRGWPRGFLPYQQQLQFLRRAKIGPNLHNSTGPVNYRTYYLPANGVMQICDNKSHLARIFTPGMDVVGFDKIEECVDLCRHYLAHDQERRRIAAHGWRTAVTQYSEVAVFERKLKLINRYMPQARPQSFAIPISVHQRRKTVYHRFAYHTRRVIGAPHRLLLTGVKAIRKFCTMPDSKDSFHALQ
jgi:hypothetical protein